MIEKLKNLIQREAVRVYGHLAALVAAATPLVRESVQDSVDQAEVIVSAAVLSVVSGLVEAARSRVYSEESMQRIAAVSRRWAASEAEMKLNAWAEAVERASRTEETPDDVDETGIG